MVSSRKKTLFLATSLFAVMALLVFFLIVPTMVEQRMNGTLQVPPYMASQKATDLHKTLPIADLHGDALLWGRNLLERSTRGHVDLPRLIEGNVALQVFSVVTKTPRGLNIERNDDHTDNILLLSLAQRWPFKTWFNLKQRALYQANRLHSMASASGGQLVMIETRHDLESFLTRRAQQPHLVAGLLAIEGAQALDGDPANVEALFQAGYRMMSPTHFFDTEMGGSAHGIVKGGLTDKGREMLRRMEAQQMIVDLAHASPQTIEDVLNIATRPVVVSHTGVKGTCNNTRNLSDQQLHRIAANGGIVGIGFWETAVCGTDARAIAKAMRYTADLIGVDHVAHGSDFDGAVAVPFDTTGLVQVTEALIQQGFSNEDIAKIMGGNELRFLSKNLPE